MCGATDTHTHTHTHTSGQLGGPAVCWDNRKHHGCQHFGILTVCFCVSSSVSLLFRTASLFKETAHPKYLPGSALIIRIESRLSCSKKNPWKNCIQRVFPGAVSPLLGSDPWRPQWSFKVLAGRRFSIATRPLKFSVQRASSSLRHFSVRNKTACHLQSNQIWKNCRTRTRVFSTFEVPRWCKFNSQKSDFISYIFILQLGILQNSLFM